MDDEWSIDEWRELFGKHEPSELRLTVPVEHQLGYAWSDDGDPYPLLRAA